jgi:hypothetical protein
VTQEEQTAFDRLTAFRERYADDEALVDGASGLTVADLDALLLRLQRTKNLRMAPVLDAADVQAFLASRREFD